MFITSKKRGYTRDGQQRAEGRFLALFEGPAMHEWGRLIMKGGKPCPRKR